MTEKVSDTLCRDWLMHVPAPILAVDLKGRICWANRALESIVGLPASQLLGHTRKSLPAPTYRVLFAEEHLIHLKGPGAPERWLKCDVVTDAKQPEMRLHCYTDVTQETRLSLENQKLRETVDNLCTTDEQTGLPNRRALRQQLELHVSRSRRYDNALSLIHVNVEVHDRSVLDDAVVAVAQHLRDRLRWADQVARWDETDFIIVLPETEEQKAREVGANLFGEHDPVKLPEQISELVPGIHMGVAGWHRGDDSRTMLARAAAEFRNAEHANSA